MRLNHHRPRGNSITEQEMDKILKRVHKFINYKDYDTKQGKKLNVKNIFQYFYMSVKDIEQECLITAFKTESEHPNKSFLEKKIFIHQAVGWKLLDLLKIALKEYNFPNPIPLNTIPSPPPNKDKRIGEEEGKGKGKGKEIILSGNNIISPSSSPPPSSFLKKGKSPFSFRELKLILPEKDYNILSSRFVDNKTYEEIGKEHGVSKQRIQYIITNILKKVKTILKEGGIS